MINILGFLSLPPIPGIAPYAVVFQPDGRYAVQRWDGFWLSVQPGGQIEWKPANYNLGGYELAALMSAGLMYRPVPGASFLLPTEELKS